MDFDDNYLIIGGTDFFNTIEITVMSGLPSFTLRGNQDIGTFLYSATKIKGTSYVAVGFTSRVYLYDLNSMSQLDDTGFIWFSGDMYWLRQIS